MATCPEGEGGVNSTQPAPGRLRSAGPKRYDHVFGGWRLDPVSGIPASRNRMPGRPFRMGRSAAGAGQSGRGIRVSETTTEEEPAAAPVAPPESEPGPVVVEGIEDEIPDEVLRLELDQFEGPFEVLLYLIKSQEIDIFDIPIVKVTEQYLRFLELMEDENLDAAGDFLVMAATLIQIKSKMILPIDIEDDEDEEEVEEEDPRLELVEKLLEYRRYRDLAQVLGETGEAAQDYFPRSAKPRIEVPEDEEAELLDITLYDLMKAIRAILRFVTDKQFHEVELEGVSVDDKIAYIEELLIGEQSLCWADLKRENGAKIHLICCLLAILELSRMRRIRFHQHSTYGDIRIFAREGGDEEFEEVEHGGQEPADVVAP